MSHPIERRHIAVGPRTVSYLAAGPPASGRIVVFLHAFPLHAEMWMPQLRAVPDGWAALAPDLRGFGGSDPDAADASRADARLEDYADDIAALMDTLGASSAAFCGCSMGGYTAFAVLRRMPARASGLLLADTRSTADSAAARESRRAMLELLEREGPGAVAAEMRMKLVGTTSRNGRPEVLAGLDAMLERAGASGIGWAVSRILNRPDATPELAAFRGPVTIVVGEEDALTPPSDAEAMAAAAPGATLVRIPRAGHLSNLESPAAFNAALREWLDRVAVEKP